MKKLNMDAKEADRLSTLKAIMSRNEELIVALRTIVTERAPSELVKGRAKRAIAATREEIEKLRGGPDTEGLEPADEEPPRRPRPASSGGRRRWNRGRGDLFEAPRALTPFGE
jgi:hypothetical protein